MDEITRLDDERAEWEAAAQKKAELQAKANRLGDEKDALAIAEQVARFLESSAAPGMPEVRPVLATTHVSGPARSGA
ncbi:hypothetical protein ACW0JT_14535 [Arthrobacter sp. SA17]